MLTEKRNSNIFGENLVFPLDKIRIQNPIFVSNFAINKELPIFFLTAL